jgi:prepilin-type N-terminal cleavage/methylation domain-containing protein/prepilin-type processing-associated H-X9-DG protein
MTWKKRKGFTLIELLVVVAIIAVLVAMLLPALNAARAQGKSLVCQTNLRQLGMIFRYYAEDHGDFIATNPVQPGGSRWYDILASYQETQNRSKNKNIYVCTAQEATVWDTYPDGTRVNPITNYAQSDVVMVSFRYGKWSRGEYVSCWSPPSPPLRFSEIETPTAKVLLADSAIFTIEVSSYLFSGVLNYQDHISPRHNHGTNALYMDGHAAWESWAGFADPNKIWKFVPDK